MPVRVVMIDDDRALLDSLGSIIDAAEGFECTGRFTSVEEAMPRIRQDGADVLLLDIQLPGISGDQALGRLREACPTMRILMLTVFSERERLFGCLCNGAHGYLLKGMPPGKLLDAIAAAREGGAPFSPEIARHLVAFFRKADPPARLAAQEQRLLSLLAEGYSYQAAADRMHVSINTVRNYIRSVYEKLHVHSKSAAVSKALREGLI